MNLKQHLKEQARKLIQEKSIGLDKADSIVDPHQDQPGSGPPAFGLPPSGQGTPKDIWGREKPKTTDEHEKQTFLDEPKTDKGLEKENLTEVGQQDISGKNFSPAVQLMSEPKELQKLYVDKPELPEEKVDEMGFGGFNTGGIGHVKKLWKFTKPPVNKVRADELSAGGAGFVTTGPRNYGKYPPGPNRGGPSPMENYKRYEFVPKKVGEDLTMEIKHNGKTLHIVKAKTKDELKKLCSEWVSTQVKQTNEFKKQIEKFL